MAGAELCFESGGGRSVLTRQYVPYPFHITRPFYLDRARPDLATLYLQSSSGGLYSGERLTLDLRVGPGAAAQVTSQASTVVHDCRGQPALQSTSLCLEAGSFVAHTPEPAILLPGAALDSRLAVTLWPGAAGVVTDGVLAHDPTGAGRGFDSLMVENRIQAPDGTLLLCDRQAVSGALLQSAMGGYRCLGSALIFGPGSAALAGAEIEARLDALGCHAGASLLPGGLGLGIRLLAPEGDCFRKGLSLIFDLAFEALVGQIPAPRRK